MSGDRRRRRCDPRGNYGPALDVIAGQIQPGDVVEVEIRHDPGCSVFADRLCDCSPRVLARSAPFRAPMQSRCGESDHG